MQTIGQKTIFLAAILCMMFLGITLVSAQNVHSWSVTMPSKTFVEQEVQTFNPYQRAGNYRTNNLSSIMTMTITKGNSTVTMATYPTVLRTWVWTLWGSSGAGYYTFKYENVSNNTFVGNLQVTDSEVKG